MNVYFKAITWIIVLLAIDLVSKYLFFDSGLLPRVFEPHFNTGISFSIAANQLIVEIITILFIICLIRLTYTKKIEPVVSVLLIAGALGNLLDRILLGGVRDFIRLWLGPVFNIADVYITLGACYLVIFEIIGKNQNSISH